MASIKKTLVKYEKTIRFIYEVIFLVYMGSYVFSEFYRNTFFEFPAYVFSTLNIIVKVCKIILLFAIILSILFSIFKLVPQKHFLKWKPGLLIVTLIFSIVLYWLGTIGDYPFLGLQAVLMLTAHNIDYRKITGVFFAITAAFLAAAVICSLLGIITNLDYQSSRIFGIPLYRYALGIVYPTDACAHLFFALCCYAITRGNKINNIDIIWMSVATLAGFAATLSYTSAICNALLVILLIRAKFAIKQKGSYKARMLPRMACTVSFPVLAIIMFVLSYFYNSNSSFWKALDKLFHSRLRLGKITFDNFNVTLTGQIVPQLGNGGSTNTPSSADYYFIDSSYMNVIFRQGLIAFTILMAILVIIQIRFIHGNNYIALVVFAIIAVQCFMEHHLIEFFYNPVFIALAANVNNSDKPVFFRRQM